MFVTQKGLTALDCGYNMRDRLVFSTSDYVAKTNAIYAELKRSVFKIKSDGALLTKIQTLLNGVTVGDFVEYEFEYKNNDDNCTMYLSMIANNGIPSNDVIYGQRALKLTSSKNRWKRISGVLPVSSGEYLSSAFNGTAFLLGFDEGKSGEI